MSDSSVIVFWYFLSKRRDSDSVTKTAIIIYKGAKTETNDMVTSDEVL